MIHDAPLLFHVEGQIFGHKYHDDGKQVYTKSILAISKDGRFISTINAEFELDPPYVAPPKPANKNTPAVPEPGVPF